MRVLQLEQQARKQDNVHQKTRLQTHASILPQSLLLFLLAAIRVADARQHSCSYQVPSIEQVQLNVPLSLDENPQEENKKDFWHIASLAHSHNKRKKRRHTRFRRDFVADREYRPLRIFLYYDPISIDPLDTDKQLFINSSLLPLAVDFWTKALFVRPSNAPIRLSRRCKSNHYYLDAFDSHPSCVDQCKTITTCGEVSIPDEHLFQCRYCALPNPLACTSSGPSDGEGVKDTDFLLYVSAVDSARCNNEDTIAYAAHCQQEAELDRPIAGHVNVCPTSLSTHQHDQEILFSTIKHEILHALGFSAGLYAFFRDSNGQPRTKRNRYNRPISFNRDRGYYDADNSTILTKIRKDWWTAEDRIPHSVHLMVTEKVVEEARKHFGCEALEGAELENQGGDGTALTHWEKRLFENEAMTGTHTQNPAYSRLTLALMEDSGWYKANYQVAETLHWGHHLGCDFAMKSCGEWIKSRLENNLSAAPFCHDIKHDGRNSLATTRCTDQRDSLALCNLVPYKKALPVDYRNFASLAGVRKEGVRYYGGSVELADFCPYNQEFEWKSVNFSDRRDSRCELVSNAPPENSNSVMEKYGHNSRCFGFGPFSWTEKKCGRVKTYSQFMAGCYEFVCRNGRIHLRVDNSSDLYTCYYSKQLIRIRRIVDGWLREGSIYCPPCDEICTHKHFWQNPEFENESSPGVGGDFEELPFSTSFQQKIQGEKGLLARHAACAPDNQLMRDKGEEIGDPLLDEPCSSSDLLFSLSKIFVFYCLYYGLTYLL